MRKITIKEKNEFSKSALDYLNEEKETKFTYAINKVLKRLDKAAEKFYDEYNEKVADINISLASVDNNGNIIYEVETIIETNGNKKEVNTQNLKYTPEKLRQRNKLHNEIAKKLLETEIEFEPYIATEIPELTQKEVDVFNGFVL